MTAPLYKPDPRLLLTGSRHWTIDDLDTITDGLIAAWRWLGKPTHPILVHGACPTGADALADALWRHYGWPVEPHPADWSIGKKAGPLRNQHMVDLGADLCLAFPLGESRGTRDCMTRARAAGIPVKVWGPEAPQRKRAA